jgi:hypothetical protein
MLVRESGRGFRKERVHGLSRQEPGQPSTHTHFWKQKPRFCVVPNEWRKTYDVATTEWTIKRVTGFKLFIFCRQNVGASNEAWDQFSEESPDVGTKQKTSLEAYGRPPCSRSRGFGVGHNMFSTQMRIPHLMSSVD